MCRSPAEDIFEYSPILSFDGGSAGSIKKDSRPFFISIRGRSIRVSRGSTAVGFRGLDIMSILTKQSRDYGVFSGIFDSDRCKIWSRGEPRRRRPTLRFRLKSENRKNLKRG